MMDGSADDIACATDNPWSMNPTGGPIATGLRVHVSDASPRGYFARVTSINAGTLTVMREDAGARALVDLSRRQVFVVDR